MHYCINSLLKNNNEIMQYCIIINDIALIMHYRALLQMPDYKSSLSVFIAHCSPESNLVKWRPPEEPTTYFKSS